MAIKLSVYECFYEPLSPTDYKLVDWRFFNSFCCYCEYIKSYYPIYIRDLFTFVTTFED